MNTRQSGKLLPENISNDHIKEIGLAYYKKFGRFQKFQSPIFHNIFPVAQKLTAYDAEHPAVAKWLFLANVYAELGSHNNDIAKSIQKLFNEAFPGKINTHLHAHSKKGLKYATVQDLSKILLILSNEHFYEKHHNQKYEYRSK